MANYELIHIKSKKDITYEVLDFYSLVAPKIAEMFSDVLKFDWTKCDLNHFAEKGLFLLAKKDGKFVGVLVAYFVPSIFDPSVTILTQQLLYVLPDNNRAAYHLFKLLIDIGRQNANYIITMLNMHTNIKPETLKKIGFKELETLYCLEV